MGARGALGVTASPARTATAVCRPLAGEGRPVARLVIRVTGTRFTTTEVSKRPTETDCSNCPECGGYVASNGHERTCEECGLVLEADWIDHGPEWRDFSEGENRRRTGAPLTPSRHDRGLSTEIGHGDQDADGNQLSAKKRRQLGRMRREQGRALRSTTSDRNQMYGLMEIKRIAGALGLGTEFRDQAADLFRTAQSDSLLPGRSVEAMAAAAVYGICRCHERPESLDDIGRLAPVASSRVRNAYTVLNRELGLPVPPRRPSAFLPAIVSELDLPTAVERRARRVLDSVPTTYLTRGANPAGIAGGAVLVVAARTDCRDCLTQRAVSEATGVSTMTLRDRRNELRELTEG